MVFLVSFGSLEDGKSAKGRNKGAKVDSSFSDLLVSYWLGAGSALCTQRLRTCFLPVSE